MTYEEADAQVRAIFGTEPNASLLGPLVGALLRALLVKGLLTAADMHALAQESEKLADRPDVRPSDHSGFEVEIPAHESEGQALTEASQTDE